MKKTASLSVVAAMLMTSYVVHASSADANKSANTASPEQKKIHSVVVMTPEQAKAALGRGACMARCSAAN